MKKIILLVITCCLLAGCSKSKPMMIVDSLNNYIVNDIRFDYEGYAFDNELEFVFNIEELSEDGVYKYGKACFKTNALAREISFVTRLHQHVLGNTSSFSIDNEDVDNIGKIGLVFYQTFEVSYADGGFKRERSVFADLTDKVPFGINHNIYTIGRTTNYRSVDSSRSLRYFVTYNECEYVLIEYSLKIGSDSSITSIIHEPKYYIDQASDRYIILQD